MISNYNLSCDYHNFELKDKIYLIPDYALKVIYTDGFNEVVFSGNTTNMTILEGHDISFQEESSFDERFRFSKSVSIKVNGYKTFNDLDYRYCVVLETKEGEFYLVNADFPSYVTHTYTLNNGTNSTELVFSSQSNIATLKLTNFEPINVNSCKQYNIPKIKNVKLTEAWASYLSTWQKSLVNKGEFVDIEPLPDSVSLTEEFDGEKYTVTLGLDIPMSYYKNDWHIKLLQFTENKYRGYIELEDGNVAFVGYNVGLFPSYAINGDIISIRLTETAIRGIAYGNDYAIIDTNIPNSIEFSGATCKNYNFESSCDWEVESKPNYITITPMSGNADTQYTLQVCNTDDETGYAVSEFIIKTCNARVRPEVVIKNPIYRYTATTDTMCTETTNERWVESGTTCTGTHGVDKWANSVKLVSYDDGETWYDSGVESATTLISPNSPDCGYSARTVVTTTCAGTHGVDKYETTENQESYDSGSTWITVSSSSTLVERNSADCGFGERWVKTNDTICVLDDLAQPFVIKAVTNCAVHSARNLFYSRDSGNTWNSLPWGPSTATTEVLAGESIWVKGTWQRDTITPLGISGTYEFEGNVMSLMCGDNAYANSKKAWNLSGMFSGMTGLTSAENLLIPATTLTESCYENMFMGCTNLATSPKLPAKQLLSYCYKNMFSGCTSLNSITCLATNYKSGATGCTSGWVKNVAANGTFYKSRNALAGIWPTGVNGIPSGWTVINYN